MSLYYSSTGTASVAANSNLVTVAGLDLTTVQPGMTIHFGSRNKLVGDGYLIASKTRNSDPTTGGTITLVDPVPSALTTVAFIINTQSYNGTQDAFGAAEFVQLAVALTRLTGPATTLYTGSKQLSLDKKSSTAVGRVLHAIDGRNWFAATQKPSTIAGQTVESYVIEAYPDGTTAVDAIRVNANNGAVDARIEEGAITAAATTDIGSLNTHLVNITGSGVAITSFGSRAYCDRRGRFSGACTLTHNATSLILPGGKNITTAAGDTFEATSDSAGNWTVRSYNAASGAAVGGAPGTASKRNRIIDPGMRVSQLNGNNAVTIAPNTFDFPSDSWLAERAVNTTGGLTAQRIAQLTPGGSPYRIRATVTAANTPAAGDRAQFQTRIEGLDVSDLRFGSASAKTITLRFGVRASVAGNYTIAVLNGTVNRSWLGSITVAAGEINTDVVKTVTLVGDTTGTWATDTGIGFIVCVVFCGGTSMQGVAGWQSGGFYALPGQVNLLATNGATFDLFDVGLYEGGVVPPFELGDFADDLRKCQRYFWRQNYITDPLCMGQAFSGIGAYAGVVQLPAPMRAAPSCSISSPAHFSGSRADSSVAAFSSGGIAYSSPERIGFNFSGAPASSFTAGNAVGFYFNNSAAFINANARL
ncbi:hypothetical protein [Methylobacterium segetis]|uniref:hypothetical protein n=1 Tax=Methylobacterium segetis TaxID=2488750 RepID=UPI0010517B10|nr:hypothetical protein [Methylobacterium segetis]